MENNKVQEIYTRLTTDQDFAEELKKFAAGKQIASLEEDAAAFIEFAKLQGYEITIDELKAFAEDKCKALSEEELDSVNAAGAGGFCIIVGVGWGWSEAGTESIFKCNCYVIGAGIGPGWKEVDAEAANRKAEEIRKNKARGCAKIY